MKRLTTPAISVLSMLLFAGIPSHGQDASRSPTPAGGNTQIDVIYTGKLLGYFRVPNLQTKEKFKGCQPTSPNDSSAAIKFLARRRQHTNAILVGTGDNFAPELEARIFSMPVQKEGRYLEANKELYFGKNDSWLFYPELAYPANQILRDNIRQGYGTIPTDNVGCFLRAAHYSAIVPGKHDFYFGVERVRQFARLLAEPQDHEFEPVQMLGANIVIKTKSISDSPGPSKIRGDTKFNEWPKNLTVSILKDGKVVYPWLSSVQLLLSELQFNDQLMARLNQVFPSGEASLSTFITAIGPPIRNPTGDDQIELTRLQNNATQAASIGLCKTSKGPNDLDPTNCQPITDKVVRWTGKKFLLTLTLAHEHDSQSTHHFSTLTYGLNYGLCVDIPYDPEAPNSSTRGCMRFAVYRPFFYHPHLVPDQGANGYNDPLPYVIKDGVAIFGVVDPGLAGQIGLLNLGWQNVDSSLTSQVSFEDPVEALRQQLDYFAIQARNEVVKLKVLLVQGNPQRAKALAAKFPQFQIVVSAADLDQGTSESEISTVWRSDRNGGFLAVPTPYYDPNTHKQTVHFGVVSAISSDPSSFWKLIADNLGTASIPFKLANATQFWNQVKARVGGVSDVRTDTCTPLSFRRPADEINKDQTYLKWLVLCAMRDYTKSDVALIQQRDLFDQIPDLVGSDYKLLDRAKLNVTAPGDPRNIQQTLDRLIWKGDLISLLYVPGSALKSALKQSEIYAGEENSSLALGVERGRALETLGVHDENGEYVVNGLPIDDKKMYAVATTDYIGAGDTGYPDLVKSALNPRAYAAAFRPQLVSISSIVCGLLADPKQFCLRPITSLEYIDETAATQTPTYKRQNWFRRVLDTSGFSWPKENEEPTSTEATIEQKVQRRGIWSFSLKQLSFGYKKLDNNRTDENVDDTFGGISTSGVTAKGNHSVTIFMDSRLSYSAYKNEFFIAGGIDLDRSSTGLPKSEAVESQNKNKVTSDIGVVLWRRPGRAAKNLGAVFSLHGETQLQQPFSTFQLGTGAKDKRQIEQDRSLVLMARAGARWQGKQNYFEIGGQIGRELRALRGYQFDTPAGPVVCEVSFQKPLKDCITESSTPPNGLVTMSTPVTTLQQGRPRAGMYWNHGFSFPFASNMTYSVTQDADFFFVNYDRDTTIDTRFRYNSKNSLDFKVFPSFYIGPAIEFFLYQNKIKRDFLFQYTIGLQAKISFDLFNRHERMVQIKQEK